MTTSCKTIYAVIHSPSQVPVMLSPSYANARLFHAVLAEDVAAGTYRVAELPIDTLFNATRLAEVAL